MTANRGERFVVIGALGSVAVIVGANAYKRQFPPARQAIAAGLVFVGVAALADADPRLAGPASGLAFASIVLAQGLDFAHGLDNVKSYSGATKKVATAGGAGSSPGATGTPFAPIDPFTGGSDYSALTSARYAGADQGVDFTGPGPVKALGNGFVTRVQNSGSGWPGEGAILVYELLDGPQRGKFVYIAEDFRPRPGLKVGDKIKAGSVIGLATGSGKAPGIEVGFAQNAHGTAYGTTKDGKAGGPTPVFGNAFRNFILTLKGH